MNQLRAVPVKELCIEAIHLPCQTFCLWSVKVCKSKQNVTRASYVVDIVQVYNYDLNRQ